LIAPLFVRPPHLFVKEESLQAVGLSFADNISELPSGSLLYPHICRPPAGPP
jgi:hypothetical protein